MGPKKKKQTVAVQKWWPPSHISNDERDECTQSTIQQAAPADVSHPYLSSRFTILVGPDLQRVAVHRGQLSQSPVLESRCLENAYSQEFTVAEVDVQLFLLLVTYLYKDDYRVRASPLEPDRWTGYTDFEKFRIHVQMYYLSVDYKLEGLSKLARYNLEEAAKPDFEEFVHIAKEAYTHLPQDDTWFSQYFRTAIKQGLEADPKLLNQPWALKFIRDGGRAATDLFSALTESIDTMTATPKVATTELPQQPRKVPCPSRSDHLAKLGNKGLWKNCKACKEERAHLISLGSSLFSLVIREQIPFLEPSNDGNNQIVSNEILREDSVSGATDTVDNEKKIKKRNKKFRLKLHRYIQQPEMQFLISAVSETLPKEDWTADCLFRNDHLRKVEGRWLWEDCAQCLQDRSRILEKIRQLDLPKESRKFGIGIEGGDEENLATYTGERRYDTVTTDNTEPDSGTTRQISTAEAGAGDSRPSTEVTVHRGTATTSFAEERINMVDNNARSGDGLAKQEIKDGQEAEQGNENTSGSIALSDEEGWSSIGRD
ncbi:hypothetical protein F5884DRAFT_863465 [Xylogone sp. PMI_703]|nr:hypothetical protein F5884DRAFT_863465 [Xylogone sp. PMI_703]